jgi:hypothetical protein
MCYDLPFAFRPATCFFLLGCSMFLAGCGPSRPETASVSGRVTYQGKPLPDGTVTFYPTAGRPGRGTIGPDGTYKLTTFKDGDGAILGKHRVTIKSTKCVDLPPAKTPAEEAAMARSRVQHQVEWLLPEKYARENTSELTAEVAAGDNTIHFDLP